MDLPTAAKVARYTYAFFLLMGGQCRITDKLTPGARKIAFEDAEDFRRLLPLIPARNTTEYMQRFGILLFLAGSLLVFRRTKLVGAALGGTLSAMMAYVKWSSGSSVALPVFSLGLVGLIVYDDLLE